MENGNIEKKKKLDFFKSKKIQKQFTLYILFGICMIILNLTIQEINSLLVPIICNNLGSIQIIHVFYCSEIPIRMSEFIGQVLAVGITVICKFLLDKLIVFRTERRIKETSIEFSKYFFFSILATIWNLGIQLILSNVFKLLWLISASIALITGYALRFFLDRKYVFKKFEHVEK